MNSFKQWLPLLIGSGLLAVALIAVLVVGPALAQGPGGGMMNGNGYGGGMMGGHGQGMMGFNQNFDGANASGCPGFGPGMMGGQGYGMMGSGGMMGGGMMWNSNSPFYTVKPLTIAETTEAVNAYLANLNNNNLKLEEVMIFDNQAYAEIREKDSGIGAMELLVDPTTKTVHPEMGPNMMWNLKYGMMTGNSGYGMMGMMRGFAGVPNQADVSADMTVTPEQAIAAAQTYLDANFASANLKAADEAEPFYGYYTLHVIRDGQVVGMLSVNGFSQQVFPHTWHGKLLEMSHE
jgi:hypothetical protein